MIKLIQMTGLLLVCGLLTACAAPAAEAEASEGAAGAAVQRVPRVIPEEGNIRDNNALYEEQDDTSVINMYLTVSSGNQGDSSDHTWEEVNAHSTYYYDQQGIERYKVEGILQIDDGSGLEPGSYGYGECVPNVTVQVRGQTSSWETSKNYKIRIKSGKEEYCGQRTLALNKHVTDPYRFLNKMSYDLLTDIPQLLSARTQFVHLYVKDTTGENPEDFMDYGIYTMVEQINRAYLRNHGLDEQGQLYKVNLFEWYDYPEIMAVGEDYDEAAFEEMLEIKGSRDHSDLQNVLEKLNNYSIPITEILEEHFCPENLCYWMAFQILIGNYDSGSRNAYLYSPLNSQRWYFISWDMDAAFRRNYYEKTGYQEGQSWERGITQYVGTVLFSRMMKEAQYRRQLDAAIHDLMDNALRPEIIAQRARAYSQVVKDDIFNNPIHVYPGAFNQEEYDQYVGRLASEIRLNYTYYLESLERPWPFFVNMPMQTEHGIVLSWDTAYEIHQEPVTYAYQLARDYEFEDVIVSDSALAVPAAQVKGLEPGTYYLRVTATNASGRTTDCFDYYSVSGIGKIYGCYVFTVHEDNTISYAGEDE